MSKFAHAIYIGLFAVIIASAVISLTYHGISYYTQSQEERFYHPDYNTLKSSGLIGHSLGVIGSLCIIIGVGTYMARKRNRSLSRFGMLKYWLEFHIFLCILGTFLIVFHSSFKASGIAAVSLWSMIIVFSSGLAGRVIYLQIPRTMEGRELDLKDVRELRNGIITRIREARNLDEASFNSISHILEGRNEDSQGISPARLLNKNKEYRKSLREIKNILRKHGVTRTESSGIVALAKEDMKLGRTLERLETMKNLFRYWHVFHLPFAIIMLIFMLVHVAVTVALGYRWIF